VKAAFLTVLDGDKSIDWDRKVLSTRSLALDVLYLLAISINGGKYQYLNGFNDFLEETGIRITMERKPSKEVAS
jgi:hypothetical protein